MDPKIRRVRNIAAIMVAANPATTDNMPHGGIRCQLANLSTGNSHDLRFPVDRC